MKKFIIITFIFFVTSILTVDFEFDGGINFNKPYLFVSLGCNCWQAVALRNLKKVHLLRDAAFPFDWLVTMDNDCLIKCLDEKFKHFFDDSYFKRYPGKEIAPDLKIMLRDIDLKHTYYNFIFTHDWPHSDYQCNEERHRGQLEFIKKKYSRRIARFDNIRSFKGKVFFMRCFQLNRHYKGECGWNAQKAKNLNEALKRFFPELDFTLVVVSCTDQTVSEIGSIDGIREYKIEDLTADNFKAYYAMFAELLQVT